MKNLINKFGGWIPVMIILIATIQKFNYLQSFISPGNDHLVASSILYAKKPFDESRIRIAINDQSKETYHSIVKKMARQLDSTGYLMPFLRKIHFIHPFYAVPNETTYAPFQFFFTALLVSDSNTLKTNLLLGRLPSLLFFCAGLLLFLYVMVEFFQGNKYPFALNISIIILSFSLELTNYAVQMESYAIGIFGIMALIAFYLRYLNTELLNNKSSLISIGFFSGLFLLMQYQLLFFSFAAICAIFIFSISAKIPIQLIAKRFVSSGLVFLLFFIPVFVMFLSKHASHVADHLIGADAKTIRYWFPGHSIKNIGDGIIYTISFFATNFWEVFRYMVLQFTPGSWQEGALLIIYFVFFLVGSFTILISDSKPTRQIRLFLLLSIGIWIGLLVSGRLAFTPDRHCLILLPLFAITIFIGIARVSENMAWRNIKTTPIIETAIVVILFISCLYSNNIFLQSRPEPILNYGIDEKSVPANSLIITNERLLWLFAPVKNVMVYYVSDDKSRRGWVHKPSNSEITPPKIYFVASNMLEKMNFYKLPDELASINNQPLDSLNNIYYKLINDTSLEVIDDEIHPDCSINRMNRFIIYEKNKSN